MLAQEQPSDPPAVTPDSVALLHQSGGGAVGRAAAPGAGRRGSADDRPEAEIAAGVTGADPSPDAGDGAGPADGDAEFTAFATAVGGTWLRGDRARVRSAGPVPSSRFA